MIEKVKAVAKKKSVLAGAALIAVTGTALYLNAPTAVGATKYVLAQVTKGTISTTVSASGQVSGENQIDVKPEVSGKISAVNVKVGQEVKEGDVLFTLGNAEGVKAVRDAQQAVRNAELSLQSAELSYKKAQKPDAQSLLTAQNNLNQAERNLADVKKGPDEYDVKKAEMDLQNAVDNAKMSDDGVTPQTVRDAYDDAVSQLKSAAQILSDSVRDADNIIGTDNTGANDVYERQLSVLDASKLSKAQSAYGNAKNLAAAYKLKADALKLSDETLANIQDAINDAEDALEAVDPLLQYTSEALQFTIPSSVFSQNSIDALRNTINSDRNNAITKRSSIATIQRSIDTAKTNYLNAQSKVSSAQLALDKLKEGADSSEIATAEERLASALLSYEKTKEGMDDVERSIQLNGIEQKRSSVNDAYSRLADAQETLSNYQVKAPFDGLIAKLEAQRAMAASPSTAMAVLLTKAKIATVTLNEVDVTKVKVGQKATLTFDAVTDLTIAGTVTEVDMIGATSQGVVSYSVKIAFLTEDERIKPGMSVSSSIITERKENVLMVPNAAIKAVNDASVVQTAKAEGVTNPTSAAGIELKEDLANKAVTVGIANDEFAEISTGLAEGDYVLVRTIVPTAAKATTATTGASTNQLLRAASGGATFGTQGGPPSR